MAMKPMVDERDVERRIDLLKNELEMSFHAKINLPIDYRFLLRGIARLEIITEDLNGKLMKLNKETECDE